MTIKNKRILMLLSLILATNINILESHAKSRSSSRGRSSSIKVSRPKSSKIKSSTSKMKPSESKNIPRVNKNSSTKDTSNNITNKQNNTTVDNKENTKLDLNKTNDKDSKVKTDVKLDLSKDIKKDTNQSNKNTKTDTKSNENINIDTKNKNKDYSIKPKKEIKYINTKPTYYKNYSNRSMNYSRGLGIWDYYMLSRIFDNDDDVTESDIAKELEERGYSKEEIDKILKEAETESKENKTIKKHKRKSIFRLVSIGIATIIIIAFIVIVIKFRR